MSRIIRRIMSWIDRDSGFHSRFLSSTVSFDDRLHTDDRGLSDQHAFARAARAAPEHAHTAQADVARFSENRPWQWRDHSVHADRRRIAHDESFAAEANRGDGMRGLLAGDQLLQPLARVVLGQT